MAPSRIAVYGIFCEILQRKEFQVTFASTVCSYYAQYIHSSNANYGRLWTTVDCVMV